MASLFFNFQCHAKIGIFAVWQMANCVFLIAKSKHNNSCLILVKFTKFFVEKLCHENGLAYTVLTVNNKRQADQLQLWECRQPLWLTRIETGNCRPKGKVEE